MYSCVTWELFTPAILSPRLLSPHPIFCDPCIYLLFNIGTCNQTARKCQFNIVSTVTASEYVLKGCSHGAIATVIYFSQLMSCMGFSVIVANTPGEHLQ